MCYLSTYLDDAVLSGESPWNETAITPQLSQEDLCLALFSDMDLALFLVIWQLIEAWRDIHFLKNV